MFKKILFVILAFLLVRDTFVYSASPTDTLQGNITSTVTLLSTKRYLIKGTVAVKQGGAIVIPAGTVLYGEPPPNPNTGTLVIERGGIIYATGTAISPIVFTSVKPIGQRSAGDWGGVVILGRARINTASGIDTAQIEGLSGIYYGGNNDNDSSGVMRYCRIEYSGFALSPNNEINGLTMGGVGSRTVIEYIMVSWNGDDSFEWFGGTVNCRYLVSYNPVDDEFDTDFGYRGKVQFGLSIRKPAVADISGSTCFESDNNNGPNFNTPRTQPTFSNITSIGPKQYDTSVVNPNFTRGGHLRRNSLISIVNSVILGWPTGVYYDGSGTTCAIQSDTSRFKANVLAGCLTLANSTSAGCSFDALVYTNGNNTVVVNTAGAQLTNPYGGIVNGNYLPLYFVPLPTSPATTGANFTYPGMNDPFFTTTLYRGAFGVGSIWADLWTNFRPDTVDYTFVIGIQPISNLVPKVYRLDQNYPNPFNPATNIRFDISHSGFATLVIFDVLGREISTLVSENVKAGEYRVNYNASNLPSGVYFYRLTVTDDNSSNIWSSTKKLMLVK